MEKSILDTLKGEITKYRAGGIKELTSFITKSNGFEEFERGHGIDFPAGRLVNVDSAEDDKLKFVEYKAMDNSCFVKVYDSTIRQGMKLGFSKEATIDLKKTGISSDNIPKYEIVIKQNLNSI